MKQRKSELLGVPYFHVVFTLPARIAAIAYQNKAVVQDRAICGTNSSFFHPPGSGCLPAVSALT
jgi:hypothetical protein